MHPTWQTLLEQPAPVAGNRPDPGLADVHGALPDLAVLRAQGPDADAFLQGQLTCDVGAVDDATSRLGAWCNPKGRIAVLFRILRREGGIDLVLPSALIDETRRRLGMYVLRAKVTLLDEPDRLCLWARGERAWSALADAAGVSPAPAHENGVVTSADGVSVVRLPGPAATALVLAPASAVAGLWSALEAVSRRADADAFELDRVRAAEPAVVPATAGAFVPQMVNLELLDGVSFTKGCYIGQEVVARTQHLGKLKRRMFRARVGADAGPGDPVYGGSASGGQSIGSVVRAAPIGDGARELLTVLRLDAVEAGELHLQQALGPSLELLELPYALDRPTDA